MGQDPRHTLRLAALGASIALGASGGLSACAGGAPATEKVAAPITSVAPLPAPAAPAAPRLADRGALAAENESATRIGLAVLEEGGTAIDAAVAMAFTSAVVQPTSCGLGGGGFAMVWDGTKATVIDFRGTAPGGLRLRDHLSTSPPWGKRGVMVAVPGFVAGLAAVHATGAALPWRSVVAGAMELANGGFVVEPWLAATVRWNDRDLRKVPEAAYLLAAGALPGAGDTRSNPALARTLRVLADKGPGAFYEGAIAEDVVRSARAAGSSMVGADLAKYEVKTREPLRIRWGSYEILAPPPPSGGGVMLAQELLAFEPEDVTKLVPGSALYTHLLSEGLREAGAERRAKVGDPAFTRTDLDELLSRERLRAVRRALSAQTTRVPDRTLVEDGGTCNVLSWDDHGRVVVITTSVGGMFGSKVATGGGYFLNDSLTDFAHDALAAKVATRGPNFPRAGARPVSSMAPTIVFTDGKPTLAIGGSGGGRVPGAILQVLHRALAGSAPLDEAIAAPRFHPPAAGGLLIEEGLAGIAGELRTRGEALEAPRASFAAVTAIRKKPDDETGAFEAVGDPRKHGSASIWRAALGKGEPASGD